MKIGREYTFSAAHYLPLVPGDHKCRAMHGHNYRVEVILSGKLLWNGFVIDFADIDSVVSPILDRLDHKTLNDVEGLVNPTAENLAIYLRDEISSVLKDLCVTVRVWENDRSWAVIPDVIDGDGPDNDALLAQWPHGTRGAPVWHMHEPIRRLRRLAEIWPRICIGSSGEYATVGDARWHGRMVLAMNEICGDGPAQVWLHMLRGMSLAGSHYPFSSVDNTDIARNHHLDHKSARAMADRWDAIQCPAVWSRRPTQMELGT